MIQLHKKSSSSSSLFSAALSSARARSLPYALRKNFFSFGFPSSEAFGYSRKSQSGERGLGSCLVPSYATAGGLESLSLSLVSRTRGRLTLPNPNEQKASSPAPSAAPPARASPSSVRLPSLPPSPSPSRKQVDLIFMAGNDPARAPDVAGADGASSHQRPSVIRRRRRRGRARTDIAVVDFYSRSLLGSEWRNRLRRSWQLTERTKGGRKGGRNQGAKTKRERRGL